MKDQPRSSVLTKIAAVLIAVAVFGVLIYLAHRNSPANQYRWENITLSNHAITSVGKYVLPAPLLIPDNLKIMGNKALMLPERKSSFFSATSEIHTFELRFSKSQNALASASLLDSAPVSKDDIDASQPAIPPSGQESIITNSCALKGGSFLFLMGGIENIQRENGVTPFAKDKIPSGAYLHALLSPDAPIELSKPDCVVRIMYATVKDSN